MHLEGLPFTAIPQPFRLQRMRWRDIPAGLFIQDLCCIRSPSRKTLHNKSFLVILQNLCCTESHPQATLHSKSFIYICVKIRCQRLRHVVWSKQNSHSPSSLKIQLEASQIRKKRRRQSRRHWRHRLRRRQLIAAGSIVPVLVGRH